MLKLKQLLGPVVGDVVMDVSTLSLDAEGNKVGIGTTGATATLHVFEPTEGDAVVQFNSGDNFPTVNRGLVLKGLQLVLQDMQDLNGYLMLKVLVVD